MPEQIYILIEQIDPNPYQTRFEDNQERINTIALSIAQDGLLQPPTVRSVDGRYQLAFGHTRTAGWKLCNWVQVGNTDGVAPELIAAVEKSDIDFSKMPAFPAEIDDEKMFRHAVTENAQRADLSAIEEATAMKKAMEEFKYTSDQAGALFGKSGATVRGKVRRAHCTYCDGKGSDLQFEWVKSPLGTSYRIPLSHTSCKQSVLSLSR